MLPQPEVTFTSGVLWVLRCSSYLFSSVSAVKEFDEIEWALSVLSIIFSVL